VAEQLAVELAAVEEPPSTLASQTRASPTLVNQMQALPTRAP